MKSISKLYNTKYNEANEMYCYINEIPKSHFTKPTSSYNQKNYLKKIELT